ncbi:MAG: hypothetical protein R3F50_16035 [Gammaproteobacteria bacterium]
MITSAGKGKGSKKKLAATDLDERPPAERHAAITGFCSCKNGIHATPGNNLGPASEAGDRNRHRNLREVPGSGKDNCLPGRPGG